MPTLTGIHPSQQSENRFEIHIDGKKFVTVGISIISELKLSQMLQQEIEQSSLDLLQEEENLLRTFDRAQGLLAFRNRSAKELLLKLRQKGEPPDLAEKAVARLVSLGLLDDAAYARQYTRAKATHSGFASRRLTFELQKRGVSTTTAKQAIQDVISQDQINEKETLEKVATKKLKSLARYDAETQKRRLFGFLARRGFSTEDIRAALRKLWKGQGDIDKIEPDMTEDDTE